MNVIRVHASPDGPAFDRVRAAAGRFDDVAGVTLVPGELVGDTIEVVVDGDPSPEREGEIRAAVLCAIEEDPDDAVRGDSVLDRLAALEEAVANLILRLDPPGMVQKPAIQERAGGPPA